MQLGQFVKVSDVTGPKWKKKCNDAIGKITSFEKDGNIVVQFKEKYMNGNGRSKKMTNKIFFKQCNLSPVVLISLNFKRCQMTKQIFQKNCHQNV